MITPPQKAIEVVTEAIERRLESIFRSLRSIPQDFDEIQIPGASAVIAKAAVTAALESGQIVTKEEIERHMVRSPVGGEAQQKRAILAEEERDRLNAQLTEAQQEIEGLRDDYDLAVGRVVELRTQLDKALEVLRWYAETNLGNFIYPGERARDFLATLDKEPT